MSNRAATFAKRQREVEQKERAAQRIARKSERKTRADASPRGAAGGDPDAEAAEVDQRERAARGTEHDEHGPHRADAQAEGQRATTSGAQRHARERERGQRGTDHARGLRESGGGLAAADPLGDERARGDRPGRTGRRPTPRRGSARTCPRRAR